MIWEFDGRRSEDCCVFHRVRESWGGLSNMSNAPLRIGEIEVKSVEALYQALRFPHRPFWQEEIVEARNAMVSKMMAKKDGRRRHHSRADFDRLQIAIMRWCIRVRIAQHHGTGFLGLLLETYPRPICEKSHRDRFWGAVLDQGILSGANVLGRLLVELRDEAIEMNSRGERDRLLRVEPLRIPDFRLLGREIGVIEAPARWATEDPWPGRRASMVPARAGTVGGRYA
jgi:ribA/ribD-fused uncharacterized protein